MNNKIYIANWKMNITSKEANSFFEKFLSLYQSSHNKEIIFCPSFTTLFASKQFELLNNSENIYFGAQNVNNKKSGAHTGEISVSMLKEIGVDYCIVGHSERRLIYYESNHPIKSSQCPLLHQSFSKVFPMKMV